MSTLRQQEVTPRLKAAEYRGDHRVWLAFDDGLEAEIDLSSELWGEMFELLRDETRFRELRFDSALATIVWPNGADFAPEFLYEKAAEHRS